ncbi:MAG TPA: 50S ribosomal protein L32e [Methanothermococcus okinawensis]|uniref:Large ribosomal subunit protein eL32 n=1 Tax=Methanothermococcus okinawensis TaxID=155863 RepID=A0A833DS08_9EURY|nr:50S ribosomal protein L32e [Methanothermococcus okinawensis]
MSKRRLLKLRFKMKQKRPDFKRQEWFKCKRIGVSWRKPRGLHSGMRKQLKHRPAIVKTGYRSPSLVRGLHPSGLEDVLIRNVKELEMLDPKTQGARIASTVGKRKKIEIIKRSEELGIRLLNISDENKRELLTLKLKKPEGPSDNEEEVEKGILNENEEDEVKEQ